MSINNAFNSHIKSLTEKKLLLQDGSTKNDELFKVNNKLAPKSITTKFLFNLTFQNLKKYSTTKKKYNIFIINSIIFDQRIHKVAVFKNNLLWDESSEFLKRFYRKKETFERIPKISEYYEKYTLFPPVYFGLEGLIVIMMNKWTKKKKTYLEYIEDHEEEKKKSKLNESFEPLINNSSLNNITSSKSLISKNTLELTKFENESKKSLENKNKISATKHNENNNNINKDKIENLSFSDIIDDLSSNYSVIIKNENNDRHKKTNNNKTEEKNKKISNNDMSNIKKRKYKNTITLNKSSNKTNNTHIINKLNIKNGQYSPKKYVKISLNKKNNKYILRNNNPNILYRNNNNNFPIPSARNYPKKILNSENLIKSNIQSKNTSKGAIRVNTITSFIQEKNKTGNKNQIIQKAEKDHSISLKKYNYNFIRNNTKKHFVLSNKKQFINTINIGNIMNSCEKIHNRIIKNTNNVLKRKNYIQIKKEPFLNINNLNNSINRSKQSSYRNKVSPNNINYFQEMRTNPNNNNNKHILIPNIPKINIDVINTKKIKDIINGNKKLYLEDPFIYKLTQLNKKKILSLTTANSLSKIKSLNTNEFNSITRNSNINLNNSKNKLKIPNKKNLVLTKMNTKNSLIYNRKRKLIGDYSLRNNSTNSSLIPKNSDSCLNFSISNKKTNNWKKESKKNNQKNINLNLNLNIHFNIGLENKNKGRKILFNNTIINQLQNKINKTSKASNVNKSKDKEIIYQYPLTTRENNIHIKDLVDMNKIESSLLKKAK